MSMPANACMLLHRSMCTFPFPPCCRALGRPSSTSEATWRCTRDIAELEEKQRAAQLQLRVWKLGRIWLGLEALVSRTSPTTRSILVAEPNLGCRRYFGLNLFITLALDFGGNDGGWTSIRRCQQLWRSRSTRWTCWCYDWP